MIRDWEKDSGTGEFRAQGEWLPDEARNTLAGSTFKLRAYVWCSIPWIGQYEWCVWREDLTGSEAGGGVCRTREEAKEQADAALDALT